jgi:hypothetical protein
LPKRILKVPGWRLAKEEYKKVIMNIKTSVVAIEEKVIYENRIESLKQW